MEKKIKRCASYFISIKDASFQDPGLRKVVTFQESMKVTLVLGQVFGLLPVIAVASKNPLHIRFAKSSWKSVYSVLSIMGQIFLSIMAIHGLVYIDSSLSATTSVIFYVTALISMLMFYKMATEWPKLSQRIAKNDELDPNFDSRLTLRINLTCLIVMTLALVEHILSLLPSFITAKSCYPQVPLDSYEKIVKHFYPSVFRFIPYSFVMGVLTQYLHVQSTFTWNFSDLFVISISYYLTSRLQQVNKKLKEAQGKCFPETFWRCLREEFGRATQVVRNVDGAIGGIVFISFANNLFFICLQLFHSLENGIQGNLDCKNRKAEPTSIGGYVTSAYFLFSLICLITRSVAVSLIASQVNSASMLPATMLYEVPSPSYCTEVQRFIDQVNGDQVALTGLQFFSITRGLLLSVAATIVTYELVMFQFTTPIQTAMAPTLGVVPYNDTIT